jgi:hypothetical protein
MEFLNVTCNLFYIAKHLDESRFNHKISLMRQKKKILHEAHFKKLLCMSDDVSIIKVILKFSLVAGNLIFSRASSILHTKKEREREKHWIYLWK